MTVNPQSVAFAIRRLADRYRVDLCYMDGRGEVWRHADKGAPIAIDKARSP